jgi:hypothetical protein
MTTVKEVKKTNPTPAPMPVAKTERWPPVLARTDKVEKTSADSSSVKVSNPATDPLAGGALLEKEYNDNYAYMSPIAWMVAITQNALKSNSELAKVFGSNFTLMIKTVRKEAKTIADMVKKDLTQQSKAAGAAATWGFVGAGASFAGAAAGGIGGARSAVKMNRLNNKATNLADLNAAKPMTVGQPGATGPSAAGTAPGARINTQLNQNVNAAPTKMNPQQKFQKQQMGIEQAQITGESSSIAGVSQGLAQGGGALGNAGASSVKVQTDLERADAGEKQQKAEGNKQIASSILQMAAEAKADVTKVIDGILGLANQLAGAFAAALRG